MCTAGGQSVSREHLVNNRQKTQLLEQALHLQQRMLAAARKGKDQVKTKAIGKRIEQTRGLLRVLGNLD
jgi:hypothetical protein